MHTFLFTFKEVPNLEGSKAVFQSRLDPCVRARQDSHEDERDMEEGLVSAAGMKIGRHLLPG